ncbi:CAP-Gly domain-containing linker protein 1-like [Poecilia formosa]|uniref:CAP-Gly domain-containing linker protein 1-like n=1 Tax=Poecilia formosa TaxID=48698 RepID=UPI00044433BA|nr:PREDICTED: CAP-Gly domain-containing linker protein 1-like [Poecilia formosa]
MENHMKEFFEEETRCQEDGRKQNQDAWIQGKDTQSGYEEGINRLKTLLETEGAKFIEERQRAINLEKELHDAKLMLKKHEFNAIDIGICSEAKQGLNTSEDTLSSELLVENKALRHELRSAQEKEALLLRENKESTALYQEVLAKLQDDIVSLSEQVETLQEELDKERTANTQTNTKKTFFKIMKGDKTDQSTELKKAMALLRKTSAEKERNLQEELTKMKESYQELNTNYQTSVKGLVQQAELLEKKLRDDEEAHAAVLKINQTIYMALEAENEALCQQLSSLQNATRETETCLQRELDQVKEGNLKITNKFETDVLTLKKRVSTLERELKDDKESHAELVEINKMLYAELQAENEALCQKMASMQDASVEAERCIQKELEQVRDASLKMGQKYEVDILALKEEIQTMEQEHRDERYRHAEIEIRNGKRAKFLHAEKNILQKELDEVKRKLFLDEVKHKEALDASTAEIERQLARNHQLSEELKEKD